MNFGTVDGIEWELEPDGGGDIWDHINHPEIYGPLNAYMPGGYQLGEDGKIITHQVNPLHVVWWG